ncbi:hypothetical protein ILUMI_09441 [Ignelater luminosus]|uniref:Ku70/Ku80 N-terminal alpha/beta domain-containing protein n=1 Tax=Ignelater luminosus TaxID=2038154 RepID=A0A8K0D2E1_IGNLU|nr:hypothetical protein ILUMI_09441 [Ignelater luminosus]
MDAYDEWKDSDEELEAEEEATGFTFKPSYVLLAIDVEESMFDNKLNRSPFLECLDACYEVANSLVMADKTSVKGPFGVVFAENDEVKANFIEFEQSVPDTVKVFQDLKRKSNTDLKTKFQRKGNFDLGDFFLFCKKKLLKINADVYKRTVIFITNEDDPIQNDPKKRFKIISESQKFPGIQMDLHVVTFKKDFDYDNLYSEVLSACNSPPVEKIDNLTTLTDKLTSLVQTRYRKMKNKFYPFKDNTDSYIEIIINKFFKKADIQNNMYVTKDTQKEVKKSKKQVDYTENYKCIYAKSEEPLIFNELEKERLPETNIPIGYSLLYVGEETSKFGWIIKSPVLMEKHHKETEPIFDCFWQFCKEKSKCLVCYQKSRKGGSVNLVELVPRFINNIRMFVVRVLPFGTEILFPNMPKGELKFEPEEELAMSNLVNALTFDYHPNNFRDPIFSKKKAYIKSQLLEEPQEQVNDGLPSDAELDEKIIMEIKELRSLQLDDVTTTTKRTQGAVAKRGGAGSRKKLKKFDEDEDD